MVDTVELDNPVWSALKGQQSEFARATGLAAMYDPRVSPFASVADADDPTAWSDLSGLVGSLAVGLVGIGPNAVPRGWVVHRHIPVLQLIETGRLGDNAVGDLETLNEQHAQEMLDLVEQTEPGPFLAQTPRLGHYFGIRAGDEGRTLVAMGGERMATGRWREVSAVCTITAYRGRGYGRRVVTTVARSVHARGELAFLHVAVGNPAIRLYESMGFEVRRQLEITVVAVDRA